MHSLYLCPTCYDWVFPWGIQCPECLSELDESRPDPSPESLRQILGEVVSVVGETQLVGRALPHLGTLYATTTGLLFLPHRTEWRALPQQRRQTDDEAAASLLRRVRQSLRRWWPTPPPAEVIYAPCEVQPGENLLLPQLLLDLPGALFVPFTGIRRIERRGPRWLLERRFGRRLLLEGHRSPLHLDRQFSQQRQESSVVPQLSLG